MKRSDLYRKILASLLAMSYVCISGTVTTAVTYAAATGVYVDTDDTVINDDCDVTDADSAIGIQVSNVNNVKVNSSEVKAASDKNAVGLTVAGGTVTVKEGIVIDATVQGSGTAVSSGYGVMNSSGNISFGENTQIRVTGTADNLVQNTVEGLVVYADGVTSLGSGSLVEVKNTSGLAYAGHFSVGHGTRPLNGVVNIGDNVTFSAEVSNSKVASGRSIGFFNEDGAEMTVGNNFIVKAVMESQTAGSRAKAEGFVNYDQGTGKKAVIGTDMQASSDAKATTGNVSSYGVYNYNSDLEIGERAVITARGEGEGQLSVTGFTNYDDSSVPVTVAEVKNGAVISAEAKRTGGTALVYIQAIENDEKSVMKLGDNITLSSVLTNEAAAAGAYVMGISNTNSAQIELGNNVNLNTVLYDQTDAGKDYVIGIYNTDASQVKFGDKATIIAAAASADDVRGVYNATGSSIEFGDAAKISAKADAPGLGIGIYNDASTVTLNGSVYVEGSDYALYNAGAGMIDAVAAGRQKVLYGDVYSEDSSITNLLLDTADSLFYGAAGVDSGGEVNISLTDSAAWQMQGDSEVNRINLANNGRIDLTQYADYQALQAADYAGNNGSIIFKTDLAGETDSDKLTIGTKTDAGITYIQVKDASLTNGQGIVTGEKKLLLVTDNSAEKAARFVGKELNAGGLWDVIPTIENGLAVGGSEEEWYLTKLAKNVNNDTEVLLNASDNSYALWRNSNDTLRKRLGDLRYRSNQTDGDGIWARYIGGKFGSGSFDGRYNMYQLGYDKAVDARSTYGIAVESGTGRADYDFGSSKDKLWTGSLYGTWYGSNGAYTDVVARYGHFDTDINSYGDYPDKANNKNHAYSLSIEYGKTIELSEKRGTFIEPQAQFIMGRMSSSSYTTDRGNNVYLGGVNSYIGRLGIVAGQKISDGNDVYFKANVLHEFGGDRDIYMRAANGETLSDSRDYGDTWFEVGLGGNIRMGKNSSFYGDIERSFGADIQKKWQVNAGVRFEF